MKWRLSRFRAGDLVEVRSKEEILATLDQAGCVDSMPFMPEMLKYCGQRVRVRAVAHKTCETAKRTYKGRRLQTTVHLEGLRCDGSAHGGCQAECNLFWKDVWLKPADDGERSSVGGAAEVRAAAGRCSETQLRASTQLPTSVEGEEPTYSCQATRLYEATQPLDWWDPRQYVRDVITGNHSLGHVLRVLWIATLKDLIRRSPFGYRLLCATRERTHRWLTGRELPEFEGTIPRAEPTPTLRLDLKPGERVRVKSKEDIVKTLHTRGENRGLYFDVEMSRYCGSVVTVRASVTKIIDEATGRMRNMKQPCIALEGAICKSEYSDCRLMCPREFPSYWREIWLERVQDAER